MRTGSEPHWPGTGPPLLWKRGDRARLDSNADRGGWVRNRTGVVLPTGGPAPGLRLGLELDRWRCVVTGHVLNPTGPHSQVCAVRFEIFLPAPSGGVANPSGFGFGSRPSPAVFKTQLRLEVIYRSVLYCESGTGPVGSLTAVEFGTGPAWDEPRLEPGWSVPHQSRSKPDRPKVFAVPLEFKSGLGPAGCVSNAASSGFKPDRSLVEFESRPA